MTTAIQVRERPILFSGEMVKAILDGRKSQTRRVIKPQPTPCDHRANNEYAKENHLPSPVATTWFDQGAPPHHGEHDWACETCGNMALGGMRCRYGTVGDQLWVRETFARCACGFCRKMWPAETPHGILGYRATYPGPSGMVFKPSIFMPRWASRITLEVTKVRVERIQEISVTDIRAEGCFPYDIPTWRGRWDAINGKRGFGWEENPWVWVIDFRQISSAGHGVLQGELDPIVPKSALET